MTTEKKQFWTRILIDFAMMAILLGGAWVKEQSARALDRYRIDVLEKALTEQKNQTTAIIKQNEVMIKSLAQLETIVSIHTGLTMGDKDK